MKRVSIIFCSTFAGLLLASLATSSNGWAALPRQPLPKPSSFISKGRYTGGSVGIGEVSLLGVDRQYSRKRKSERILLTFGDSKGYPRPHPGYYHIAVENDPPRIVIDFSRMQKAALSELGLRQIFKGSAYVESSLMTMDPEDHSTNLTLRLTEPIEVATFERAGRSGGGQLVIDLRPIRTTQKRSPQDQP